MAIQPVEKQKNNSSLYTERYSSCTSNGYNWSSKLNYCWFAYWMNNINHCLHSSILLWLIYWLTWVVEAACRMEWPYPNPNSSHHQQGMILIRGNQRSCWKLCATIKAYAVSQSKRGMCALGDHSQYHAYAFTTTVFNPTLPLGGSNGRYFHNIIIRSRLHQFRELLELHIFEMALDK